MEENLENEIKKLTLIEEEDEKFDESVEQDQDKDDVVLRMRDLSLLGNEAVHRKKLERAQKARAIKEMAFDQKNLSLVSTIPLEQLQLLIDLLVKDKKEIMDTCYAFIHKRLEFCLNPLIPSILKTCWGRYPKSMAVNPGFMYEASEEHGGGARLWVHPNIPFFFGQEDIMDVLYQKRAQFLPAIDRAVKRYVNQEVELTKAKFRYAERLSNLKKQNYFELLSTYPLWFEVLYNELYNKKEKL